MRVLLNYLVASGRKTGIGYYASELVRCLRAGAPDDTVDLFPGPWLRWCWGAGNRLRPLLERRKKTSPVQQGGASGQAKFLGLLRQGGQALLGRRFRSLAGTGRYDLYHEPNYLPLPCDLPTVTSVHDLSILLHPEWHPADRVRHFERNFARTLTQSRHFVAISETGRQELIRHFGIAPERVTRTYMGVRPGLGPLAPEAVAPVLRRLGLPEQYLLYLGTIEPRKNVLLLLKTYCSLPADLRERWPLLLVGGWGWNTAELRAYLDTEARHRGVLHVGYVADADLAAVYNGARALVYPSHYEGFGLPPVEMFACGGAVLGSTAGALVEVAGRQAHLTPAEDADGWRDALCRVVTDDDWWQSLRRGAVEAARPFTWEQCAADTLRAYRATLGQPVAGGDVAKAA